MQSTKPTNALKFIILGLAAALLVFILTTGIPTIKRNQDLLAANVPQQGEGPNGEDIPDPEPTTYPPLPGQTATRTPRPATPIPAVLQAPTPVTYTVSNATTATDAPELTDESSVDTAAGVHSMAWAPTGDKFIYVTKSGNLYWSNTDGTNATLLHQYDPDTIWRMLEDQQPMANTLFLTHVGPVQGLSRGPGHMDVVRFTFGQAPTLEEVPSAGGIFQIRWWASDRASGIVPGTNVGGDKLVTLDENAHRLEERNIPHMVAGAVQPGGQWLAYVTGQQTDVDVAFTNSAPETVYLLDLITGQRKQVTPDGMGYGAPYGVHSWSPDGNWFLMGAKINGALRGVLVSADGSEWVTITPPGYSGVDAVWSPDSTRLAFSIQSGGQDEPGHEAVPLNSAVYFVNIPQNSVSELGDNGPGDTSTSVMMQPKWSPDGSQISFLSFDPECVPLCSKIAPALHLMALPK